jgi:hypothetical protein
VNPRGRHCHPLAAFVLLFGLPSVFAQPRNPSPDVARFVRVGSIEAGKNADLLVIKGDPSQRIADIENVEIVFKDGLGYDTEKLLRSVAGRYGQY